jgi:hypothetical protein
MWKEQVIEKLNPFEDSPARLASSSDGHTIYALFQRLNSSYGKDLTGDVVLVRDDGDGNSGFIALGNGTLVANGVVLPNVGGTSLGAQRLFGNGDVASTLTEKTKFMSLSRCW